MRTLTALVILSLAACTQRGASEPAPAASAAAVTPSAEAPRAAAPTTMVAPQAVVPPGAALAAGAPPPDAQKFGASLSASAPVPLATVLTAPDAYSGKDVVVDGKVRANCTRKGCWMELASAMDKDAPGCRVTFKDYGFFVPLNSQGSQARVEGQVAVKTIPAAEVAHLEGEGGRFPGKLTDGSAREVRIVASGVALWRAN